ncbi:MAG TPA: amidotransferase [Bacteroidetes bacterium]|nr:amidotransferase [Bacteroidota bacterium]
MKIAFLLCDHVDYALRPIHGDYPEMFSSLFPDLHFEIFTVCEGHFPKNANDFDAYFVNGSHRSVYDETAWIVQLKNFVKSICEAKKKYVGVCFGHQMLAEALGGKVAKSEHGWCVGAHEFEIVKREGWMLPFRPSLNLLMMCQDQVLRLPPGGVVLAKTEKCPVGIFRVGAQMLGIQAHPEFSKEYDRALMEMRTERMGKEVVRQGTESLKKEVGQKRIAEWVRQFLQKK